MSLEKNINLNSIAKSYKDILNCDIKELNYFAEELLYLSVKIVKSLNCTIFIKRDLNNFYVNINGDAELIQECGNTLEDITTKLKLNVNRHYLISEKNSLNIDKIDEDVIIINKNEKLNVYDVIIEELSLLVDPYVTKDNSNFKEYIEEKNNESNNPFANFFKVK